MRLVTATEAARSFSELLDRVQYRGERIVVERGGSPVCEISPAGPLRYSLRDLIATLRAAPKPDAGYWSDLDRVLADQPVIEPSSWAR